MTTTHETTARAAVAARTDGLTDEQLEDLTRRTEAAWDAIGPGLTGTDREEAREGALRYVTEGVTIGTLRQGRQRAQDKARRARMRLRGAVIAAVATGDLTSSQAAGQAGVAVSTVTREWGA